MKLGTEVLLVGLEVLPETVEPNQKVRETLQWSAVPRPDEEGVLVATVILGAPETTSDGSEKG